MDDWPAVAKWNSKYLKAAFGEQQTLAGDYVMSFDNFLAYSRRAHDEMPLYLFDKHFADNVPQLAEDYQVGLQLPHCVNDIDVSTALVHVVKLGCSSMHSHA